MTWQGILDNEKEMKVLIKTIEKQKQQATQNQKKLVDMLQELAKNNVV
jgi:hypothetical protein